MIKVVIVDDHQLFAEGLAAALNAVPDIEVTTCFHDGSDFLTDSLLTSFDVLILDLEMPISSGFDVLKAMGQTTKTVVVSMHTGDMERLNAFKLGARAFLSKAAPLADVAATVRAVNDDHILVGDGATLSDIVGRYRNPTLDPGAASLTPRERELLTLIARGVTGTDELADTLFISQKTVKNHLASIYGKLAISDRAQAVVEAIRLGLDHD